MLVVGYVEDEEKRRSIRMEEEQRNIKPMHPSNMFLLFVGEVNRDRRNMEEDDEE